ncbi:MAG: hypothetical protein ACW963_07565 [Candidatus Sifarchaeia archaeon]|jgi:hypothetical protein
MAIFIPIIILILGIVGWGLCGLSFYAGVSITSITNALIIHAIAAPIIFYFISLLYFKKFNYTTPVQTAIYFLGIVILLDFFVVSLLINKNFDMFLSPLGTWIPFLLIFLSTFLTGSYYTQTSIFK